jgi:hypothetical protein
MAKGRAKASRPRRSHSETSSYGRSPDAGPHPRPLPRGQKRATGEGERRRHRAMRLGRFRRKRIRRARRLAAWGCEGRGAGRAGALAAGPAYPLAGAPATRGRAERWRGLVTGATARACNDRRQFCSTTAVRQSIGLWLTGARKGKVRRPGGMSDLGRRTAPSMQAGRR